MYDHAFIMKNYSCISAHMTKTNTTQVLYEYPLPEQAEHPPPTPDHAGSIPDLKDNMKINILTRICSLHFHLLCATLDISGEERRECSQAYTDDA